MPPIVKRNGDFVNTGRARLGGSSYSSGVFRELWTNALWIGKAEACFHGEEIQEYLDLEMKVQAPNEEDKCKIASWTIREKLASDIYTFFGANVANMAVSE